MTSLISGSGGEPQNNQQPLINQPPPIPPRPNDQYFVPTQRFGPYGGPSSYFGMGNPVHPYGMQMVSNANQQIDSTFQSIQSMVQAFSSISMMLESTYMAVHSSFRAVIDVADHFNRLKDSLAGVLSMVTMMKTIRWFYRKILYMFNLVGEEQVWADSLASAQAVTNGQMQILDHTRNHSSWPMLMFLGAAIGAPWVIYTLQKPSVSSTKWINQKDDHYIGEALYDFETNQPSEIPLKAGQKVIIAPKEQQPRVTDWLLATTDGKRSGLIPINYVKIVKFDIMNDDRKLQDY